MALFEGSVYSEALQMRTRLTVYLPVDNNPDMEGQKTLYLLHGLMDGCDSWLFNTNICRYAQEKNMAVIMPEGHRGFYSNIPLGGSYFTYIHEELPALCKKMFCINSSPERTMIAGNSMGGYGALKNFLTSPQNYGGGCFAFSPVISMEELEKVLPNRKKDFDVRTIWSLDGAERKEDNLYELARQFPKSLPGPYITCGTEDFLFPQNIDFHNFLIQNGIAHSFDQKPGIHEWQYWENALHEVFDRLT